MYDAYNQYGLDAGLSQLSYNRGYVPAWIEPETEDLLWGLRNLYRPVQSVMRKQVAQPKKLISYKPLNIDLRQFIHGNEAGGQQAYQAGDAALRATLADINNMRF